MDVVNSKLADDKNLRDVLINEYDKIDKDGN